MSQSKSLKFARKIKTISLKQLIGVVFKNITHLIFDRVHGEFLSKIMEFMERFNLRLSEGERPENDFFFCLGGT